MIIKYLKKGKNNTYEVTMQDNNKVVKLFDDIIVKYSLLPKKEISEKEFITIKNENDALESYYIAVRFLNFKLRTKKEMKQYLARKGYNPSAISKTIIKLEKEGYLNEENYIRSFINDGYRFSSDGPLKLKKKLLENGLEETIIDEILQEISKEDWILKLEKIYQKKVDSHHTDGLEKWKLKCWQYLIQLGYPKSWIEELTEKIIWPKDEKRLSLEYEKLLRILSRKYQGNELRFQLKRKLYNKGFTKEEIDEIVKEK